MTTNNDFHTPLIITQTHSYVAHIIGLGEITLLLR